MNKCIMLGRLTRDVEIRESGDKSVAKFSIAVNRRFKNTDGVYEADFINCTAFGGTADFIAEYFSKGSMIGIVGRWTTGSYTNTDNVKIYTNDLIVEEVDFAGFKPVSDSAAKAEDTPNPDVSEIVDAVDDSEDDLPF